MENILINVDSKFRDTKTYPNSGLFTYKLKEPIKNISYIRLSSIELPTIFYAFTEANKNISFTLTLSPTKVYEIIIPEGNYDVPLLFAQIQNNLDTINNKEGTIFLIAVNEINYKVTFTNNTPFSLIFNNESNSLYRTLGNRLGFRKDNNGYLMAKQQSRFNPTLMANQYYWTGEAIIDISKDDYCFLRVNDYGVIYNDIRDNALLAKLILYDNQYVIDNGSNFLTKSYIFKQPINIAKMEIELISKYGQTIKMDYLNYSMTFEFGQNFDKNSYNQQNYQVK